MSLSPFRGQGLAARIFDASPVARLALLRACWRVAVGAELASRTEVLAVEGEALRLRVPDARWRKVLHRMERELLQRLRESVGELAPKRLGFTEGPVTTDVAPAEPPASPAPRALPARVVESAATIRDPEIRERFLETAARYLSRAQP